MRFQQRTMTDDNRLHAQINRETTLDKISSASIRHFSQNTCDTDIKPTCYLHTVCFHVNLQIKLLHENSSYQLLLIMLTVQSIVQKVNYKSPSNQSKKCN